MVAIDRIVVFLHSDAVADEHSAVVAKEAPVADQFLPGPGPHRPARLSVGQTFTATWAVAIRTWPYLAAMYVGAIVLSAIGILIIAKVGFSLVGSGGTMAGAIITALIIFAAISVWGFIVAAPFAGTAALVTDDVIHRKSLNWTSVLHRLLPRLPALIGCMLASFGSVMLASAVLTAALLFIPGIGMFGMLLAFTVAVSLVILLDLAPWVMMNEGCSVLGSLTRATVLAKRSYLRLLGLHLLWGVVLFPLLLLAMEAGGFLTFVVLLVLVVAVVPLYMSFQGVVYAGLVAHETGTPIDIDFAQPVMTGAGAIAVLRNQWDERSAALGSRTGSAAQSPLPTSHPSTRPAHRAVPPRPHAELMFNPPPGWPTPPTPEALADGFAPDPTWAPAPPNWQFWVPRQ